MYLELMMPLYSPVRKERVLRVWIGSRALRTRYTF